MPTRPGANAASRFQLSIDGVQVGFVKSVDGGSIRAPVIAEASGASYFFKKHIGPPTYEPVSVQFDLSMAKAIYGWIAAQWNGDFDRKDVSIIECDDKFVARAEREFQNARISEVTIPSMDGSAKDGGYLTVQFAPESTRDKKASGKLSGNVGKPKQKQWLRSNFRLEIAGLDCSKVSKVESFTVKQLIQESAVGELRSNMQKPGPIDFPKLNVTFSQGTATSWVNWFEDFVIKGNCAEGDEKNGSLIFLAPNLKNELGRVNLYNLGIVYLAQNQTLSQRQIRTMTVELYCERMELVVNH